MPNFILDRSYNFLKTRYEVYKHNYVEIEILFEIHNVYYVKDVPKVINLKLI